VCQLDETGTFPNTSLEGMECLPMSHRESNLRSHRSWPVIVRSRMDGFRRRPARSVQSSSSGSHGLRGFGPGPLPAFALRRRHRRLLPIELGDRGIARSSVIESVPGTMGQAFAVHVGGLTLGLCGSVHSFSTCRPNLKPRWRLTWGGGKVFTNCTTRRPRWIIRQCSPAADKCMRRRAGTSGRVAQGSSS